MKKYVFLLVVMLSAIITSCQHEKKFEINGHFTSATDDVLYLEHRALGGIEIIDSVKLNDKGKFKFKKSAPENPEFYQFRINNQIVVFAVDSTEKLDVTGDMKNLHKSFVVENSIVNQQIREVDNSTTDVRTKIKELENSHTAKRIDDLSYLNSLDSVLNDYKSSMTKLVLGNPGGAVAYYVIFQKINDYLIFDPHDKKDYSMFGAVATSWDKYYHDTPRSKHLYDFTMKALRERKNQEQQVALIENAPIVTNSSLPDIELREVNGRKSPLSEQKGKVVILDFTVYNSEFSPRHNVELNKMYSRLNSSGLEIYQISFDSDEHFWKNAASNLPWITVRDPQSVYSNLLTIYNVRDIPTAFILDRNGDVVARVEDYNTLISEISKLL